MSEFRTEEFHVNGEELIARIKALIHQGNIRRIIIKDKDGKTLIEFPLTIGVVGLVLAPTLAAVGAIAALVTEATIVVEKGDLTTRKMKNVRFGRVLIAAAIALQVAWYAVLMVSYIRTPGKLEGADFLFYYSVGRVARDHGLEAVYILDLEAAAQAEVTGRPVSEEQFFLPNHPPFLYPMILLISSLDYRPAYLSFAVFLYILVAAGLPSLRCALKQNGWSQELIFVMLAGVFLFEPLFISVLKGQDSAFLLLGGLLWFSGLTRKNDRLAGLGLSLTLIRPQIALMLALPFLFKNRKVFYWFLTGAVVLGVYSFWQVGWTGTMDYLQILSLSARGEGYGLAETAMVNLTGLILRLVPLLDLGLVHNIGWGIFTSALAGLCVLWGLSKTIGNGHIALAVTLSLFAAPHLNYHDLALLTVPLVALGVAGASSGRLAVWCASALPMGVSLLFLFSEFWTPAWFSVPYLLMAVLPILTWKYENRRTK